MKKNPVVKMLRPHRTVLLLAFALLLAAAMFDVTPWRGTAQDLQTPLLPLRPDTDERITTSSFVYHLENSHISQRTLDQTLAKEAFRLYIKSLDPRKLFFYQSDIDEFREKYEMRFCDLVKAQPTVNVQPAFDIYNRYLLRLKERVATAQEILSAPMDFTVDEEYVFDKSRDFTLDERIIREKGLQTFPQTPAEANERWRKRLKFELLGLKFETITGGQKQKRAIAEGKEPEEVDDRDPVERLRTRYASLQRRMLFEGRIENNAILASVRKQANYDVMELFLNAISGAFDPHTAYMSPSTVTVFDTDMSKNFEGIGATLSSDDGYIVVRDVLSGSPAEKAEIKPKDKIQGVGQGKDGKIEEVIDFKVTDVVKLIRGEKGTTVRLDILPGGKGPSKVVDIVRDRITLDDQAAHSEIFEADRKADGTPYKIGFIELPGFYLDQDAIRQGDEDVRSATTDVKKILQYFVEADVDAVVLDLRSNGGGFLHIAIEITGLFLGSGVVVQVKDEKSARPQPRPTPDSSCAWTGPLVVLTNKFSASASEIVAGAIKEYKRGIVIGDSVSHGKGTVQSVVKLNTSLLLEKPLGSGKITIQGYYLPSGVSPQGVGVAADIVLPSLSDVLEDVMESDLDNALTLQRVPQAPNFTPKQYVSPQIIHALKNRSVQRVGVSEDFAKQQEKIVAYKEARARRATSLNEAKYIEEMQRFNTDEWEREELEDLISKDKKSIKRTFYEEEVLAITVDYIKATQEFGVAFPKERTIQPPTRRGIFGFGGLGL